MATVGYGDFAPHTTIGRRVAILLMLIGVTRRRHGPVGRVAAVRAVHADRRAHAEDPDLIYYNELATAAISWPGNSRSSSPKSCAPRSLHFATRGRHQQHAHAAPA